MNRTREFRIVLSLVGAVVFTFPVVAEAQVVVSVSGTRNDDVASAIEEALEDAGHEVTIADGYDDAEAAREEAHARAAAVGEVSRRSGRYRVSVVVSVDGEDDVTLTASGRTFDTVASQIASRVADRIGEPGPARVAQRRRIVVGEFTGSGASRVRQSVVQSLQLRDDVELVDQAEFESAAEEADASLAEADGIAAAAAATGVSAYIVGEVGRQGRQTRVVVTVYNGANGRAVGSERFVARTASALGTELQANAASELDDKLARTEAPERRDVAAGDDEQVADNDVSDEESDEGDEEEDAESDDGEERAYNALDFGVLVRLFSRNLSYTDDVFSRLRAYSLGLGPSLRLEARWYPGAHFTNSFAAHIGIEAAWDAAFGVDSKRADGTVYETSAGGWLVGLRGRYPIEEHEVSVGVGYGSNRFAIASESGVPSVSYGNLRFAAEGRFHVFSGLRATVRAAYLFLMSAGDIASQAWFPRMSGGGIEAGLVVGWELDLGLEIRVGFDLRRYFFSMNPEVGDANVAGGGVDQYLGYSLGIAYRL